MRRKKLIVLKMDLQPTVKVLKILSAFRKITNHRINISFFSIISNNIINV